MTHYAHIKVYFVLMLLAFQLPAFSQEQAEDSLAVFNNQRYELEYLLRQKECETEIISVAETFTAELRALDSLVNVASVADLPTLVNDNKFLIVDAYKEGDVCNYVSYDRIKYAKGCAKPFFTDSVEWTHYKSFMSAKANGRLCVEAFQMSGYTQVDKVPAAKISEESAKRLLAQIKRTLTLYNDKIGYSYADYVAYEQKKEVTQLRELILLRTSFLKSCIKKIKS